MVSVPIIGQRGIRKIKQGLNRLNHLPTELTPGGQTKIVGREIRQPLFGKANADLDADSDVSVSIKVWRVQHSDSTEIETEQTIDAYDWYKQGVLIDDPVFLFYHHQSARWYFIRAAARYSYAGLERDTFFRYERTAAGTPPVTKFNFDGSMADFDSSSDTSDDSLEAGTEGAYSFHFSSSLERSTPGSGTNKGPLVQMYIYINDGSDGILPIVQVNCPTINAESPRVRVASNFIILALAGDEFDVRMESNGSGREATLIVS